MVGDALGQGRQLVRIEALAGLMRVRADPRDRDVDGRRLARAALRDERRQTPPKALRSFRSGGHEATIISSRAPLEIRPSLVLSSVASAEYASRTRGLRRIPRDRQPVARCLRQADIPRDDRVEHARSKVSADFRRDIGRQLRPAVEHRQHDTLHREGGIEVVSNEIERGEQLGQSFQGVVLTLERNENGVGSGQCVDGEETERWRAVDEQIVVAVLDLDNRRRSRRSRPSTGASSISAPASAIADGMTSRPSIGPGMIRSPSRTPSMTAS